MSSPALLTTKYQPPPLRERVVERPDLAATLAESRRLLLVSAPPGYGKTTVLAAWLRATGTPAAWLTLDPSDDDPAVFVAYLVAAIRRVRPDLDPAIDNAVRSAPEAPATLNPLVNALADGGQPLTIVLDDYQSITSGRVHDLVAFLARHLPPSVRIAIASREDPPLPLSRARARGDLTELRAGDLRFSPADAGRFLRETMDLELSDEARDRLTDQTEGWIAGLQLAGLSLRGRDDPSAFIAGFSGTDRYVLDYLVDEALARQPAEVRRFLEATSILERLSGSLCDALTGLDDGAETLVRLESANVFLTPLDDQREWYQLHRLFADLLRSMISPTEQARLHGAAAAWFAANDQPSAAIHHAFQAKDPELAASLIEGIADDTLARGEFATLVAWGDRLPRATLIAHPAGRVTIALARFFRGDLIGAEGEVRAMRATARAVDRSTDGRLACLEAWLANRADRPDAGALARRAIELIPAEDTIVRSLAFGTLGETLVGGDVEAALVAYRESHRLGRVAHRSTLELGSVYSIAMAELIRGRRREAEEGCRIALRDHDDGSSTAPPALGMVHLALAGALFEADDLETARRHIAVGNELCERAGLRSTMLGASEWVDVRGLHLAGETDAAWRRLESSRREGERLGLERVVLGMRMLAAELLLAEGKPADAIRRLELEPVRPERLLGAVRDRARQTQARVHALSGNPAGALAILDPLADEQRAGGRLGRLVTTLCLVARAREAERDLDGARTALSEAIGLAADEGYRRPFLDPGAPSTDLLQRLRPLAPTFVDDLLARRRPAARRHSEGAPDRRVVGRVVMDGRSGPLVEPLSDREVEILRLVAAGLSNDEIGRALYITSGTAKWHVHNLIGKLGGRDRVSMLAEARSAGLV